MATPADILRDTMNLMAQKKAQYGKEALVGEDPNSLPGAEHTRNAPKEDEKPDPEVNDKTMGPASSRDTSGAGDDSPVTRGQAEKTDELPDAKEKKPLIDTESKSAKLANDIIAQIRDFKKALDEGGDKPKKEAAVPAEGEEEGTPAEKTAKKSDSVELTQEVLAKMAAIALSYEEGQEFMEQILEKHAGAEQAAEVMSFLEDRSTELEKKAAEEQGFQDGLRALVQEAYQAGLKDAGAVDPRAAEMYKLGQMLADESMEGLPPELLGGELPPEAAGVPGDIAGAPEEIDEDITLEDVAEALDLLVQEGTVDPETAAEIQQQVAAEVEAAGAGEGGEPIPDAAPVEGDPAPVV